MVNNILKNPSSIYSTYRMTIMYVYIYIYIYTCNIVAGELFMYSLYCGPKHFRECATFHIGVLHIHS